MMDLYSLQKVHAIQMKRCIILDLGTKQSCVFSELYIMNSARDI